MDESLTTGQMIDTLQIGEKAVTADNLFVIRNSLGYFWTFRVDKKNAWKILEIDSKTVELKWKILKESVDNING